MIGARLREARLARKLSLHDVSGIAAISASTLSRIENEKQNLDVALLLSLARILGVDAALLIRDEGSTPPDEPLAHRIAALGHSDRAGLWRDLAVVRRRERTHSRPNSRISLANQLEELLAEIDFVREEIEAARAAVTGGEVVRSEPQRRRRVKVRAERR